MRFLELLQDLKNEDGLIEHEGQMYTPEELVEHLTEALLGQFEIVDSDEVSWFEQALNEMDEEEDDNIH